jgi:hypothetical protein
LADGHARKQKDETSDSGEYLKGKHHQPHELREAVKSLPDAGRYFSHCGGIYGTVENWLPPEGPIFFRRNYP